MSERRIAALARCEQKLRTILSALGSEAVGPRVLSLWEDCARAFEEFRSEHEAAAEPPSPELRERMEPELRERMEAALSLHAVVLSRVAELRDQAGLRLDELRAIRAALPDRGATRDRAASGSPGRGTGSSCDLHA